MQRVRLILGTVACGLFMACGDSNGGNQLSSNPDDGRSKNYGSATDITPAHGNAVDTNQLNVADNGLGGSPQRQSGNFQSPRLPGDGSDEELAKQIKVVITTGSLGTTGAISEDQLTKIDVRVRNGVVALSGPVSSEAEKQTIEKQVAGIKGVRSVRNQLSVGGRNVQDKPIQPIVPRNPGNQ